MARWLDDETVMLRHARTEQTVMVSFGQYRRQAAQRFRNWRLARGNLVPRPCLTISECLMAPEGRMSSEGRPAGGRNPR